MRIWFWIALYLVIGFGLTYWIHKDDKKEDRCVLGFIFVSLTWPIETLLPFLYGVYLAITGDQEKIDKLMESDDEESRP